MKLIETLHIASAVLFIIDYVVKSMLLVFDKNTALDKYKAYTKVISMIISTIFLVTGIYWLTQIGMKTIGGWFHLKLTITIIGLVLGIIGFKKKNKAMVLISTFLFVYIYFLSTTKSVMLKKANMNGVVVDTAAANYDELVHGKAIYINNCLRCHGEDGKAGINGASNLTASMCENKGLIGIIKHGRNLMPAYKDVLSEVEINAVASYVKSLRSAE
jgi:mono/diheme cytochrome c family protein